MLTPYRSATLAACIAILCHANSSAQQNASTQSNQDQQQAQSNQPNSSQPNAASDQSNSSQPNQASQQNQQSADQSSSIRNEGIATGQQGSSQQQSNQSTNRDAQQSASGQSSRGSSSAQQSQSRGTGSSASSGASGTTEWPAPERYEYRGRSNSGADRGSSFQSSDQGRQGRRRASLGVNIISGDGRGITVMRTQPNTAAQRMGLRPQDRIIALNGQPVDSIDDFIGTVGSMNPGDEIELTVERNGEERTIRGTLEAYAESISRFEGPVAQGINRIRGIIGRERGPDMADDRGSVQTSYEDQGGSSSRSSSGDSDARINRLERQIDRLNREIQELREARNSSQPGSAASGSSSGSSDRNGASTSTSGSSQPGSSSPSSSNSSPSNSSSGTASPSGGNIPAPNASPSR